jgi:hypothetical protein
MSIGRRRKRTPVAAKTALATACWPRLDGFPLIRFL